MSDRDDELGRLLRPLDPAATEPAPARGSDRYRSIQEKAMHSDDHLPTVSPDEGPPPSTRSRRRGLIALAAAAVVVVIGVVGALVVGSGEPRDATATLHTASAAMAEITSLEAELERTSAESTSASRLLVDGESLQMVSRASYQDGHQESLTTTVVDGVLYETVEGTTTRAPLPPGQGLAPFGPSSDALLSAATTDSEITEVGEERVGDVRAVRYDIVLGPGAVAALSALSPNELGWFELEYPELVDRLSVWIADDLVHQIEVVQGDRKVEDEALAQPIEQPGQTIRTRFFNFDGDVRVEAPPGPYVEPGS